ncbi:MAG: hypothetical protein JSV74_03060 [Dehalococcoidia bacterium]|nr:MAG: hypothetical protein JSV74_03060 [Dehalococcoidia bacterium]
MKSPRQGKTSEISSDIFMILVTVANLIFFAFFHRYIAWFTTEPDGSAIRLSMLTDEYFIWLPIAITASILAIVAYSIMLFYRNDRFRMTAEIVVITAGVVVATSIASIFPFDFSVIPNATLVNVLPVVARVLFILLAIFYGVTILIKVKKLKQYLAEQETI